MPRKAIDLPYGVDYLSILDEDGALDKDLEPDLADDLLLRLHRTMLLGRRFDERMLSLQRQGRLGTFAPTKGQEARKMYLRVYPISISRHVHEIQDLYYSGYKNGDKALGSPIICGLSLFIHSSRSVRWPRLRRELRSFVATAYSSKGGDGRCAVGWRS